MDEVESVRIYLILSIVLLEIKFNIVEFIEYRINILRSILTFRHLARSCNLYLSI